VPGPAADGDHGETAGGLHLAGCNSCDSRAATRAVEDSVNPVHPIERLRYVARAGHTDPTMVAVEAALALADLPDEPGVLLTSVRRLIDFHPSCGPL
jgi:hypothetical protein